MEKRDRYPIGQQDFKMLRTRGSYYVYRIGANFSSESRTIGDWLIETGER